MIYILTFLSALAAATILPFSSEATLLYYLSEGYDPWILFVAAGVGNVLGSIVNYLIGEKGVDYLVEKNKISSLRLAKNKKIFDKYGLYTLLLSWVPVIGDPLTLVAGALKYNFFQFIMIVSFAKFSRYLILITSYLYFW